MSGLLCVGCRCLGVCARACVGGGGGGGRSLLHVSSQGLHFVPLHGRCLRRCTLSLTAPTASCFAHPPTHKHPIPLGFCRRQSSWATPMETSASQAATISPRASGGSGAVAAASPRGGSAAESTVRSMQGSVELGGQRAAWGIGLGVHCRAQHCRAQHCWGGLPAPAALSHACTGCDLQLGGRAGIACVAPSSPAACTPLPTTTNNKNNKNNPPPLPPLRCAAQVSALRFAEQHRRLVNVLVHHHPSLLTTSMQALMRMPRLLDFDNK